MKFKNKIKVFGITELVNENEFFDYDAKYNGNSKEITRQEFPKSKNN